MNLIPKTNARIPITTPMFAESTPVTAVVNVVTVSAGNTVSPAPKTCSIPKPFLARLNAMVEKTARPIAQIRLPGVLRAFSLEAHNLFCKRTKREHN